MTFDTYRTLEVQQSLYQTYLETLRSLHPDWPEEALSAETQKYVSIPSRSPSRPSPHNTAGSTDLAIVEVSERLVGKLAEDSVSEDDRSQLLEHATLLSFGTRFDHGGPEAALAYFEQLALKRLLTTDEREAQLNRRLLYRVMVEVGMVAYEEEWWHFNARESQMGAKADGGRSATYGAVVLNDKHLYHEHLRRAYHRSRIIDYVEGRITVNPIVTKIGRAAVISPSRER